MQIFLPNLLPSPSLKIDKCDLVVPITFYVEVYVFSFTVLFESFAFKLECFITEPTSSGKFNLALLIRSVEISYGHSLSNINIDLSDDKIMDTENWRL